MPTTPTPISSLAEDGAIGGAASNKSFFKTEDVSQWIENTSPSMPIRCTSCSVAHPPPDSGYGTQNNSSFQISPVKEDGRQGDFADEGGVSANSYSSHTTRSRIRSVPLPGREDLSVFRGLDMDYTYTARFRELLPELERHLHLQLQQRHAKGSISLFPFQSRKSTRRRIITATTMSIRLMMIGEETADSAKPCIVIFVQEGDDDSETRHVESLIQQPKIRQLCQPDDGYDGGLTPSFSVIVVGQAPRKRAGGCPSLVCGDNNLGGRNIWGGVSSVSITWDAARDRYHNLATYCGTQIRLEQEWGWEETSQTRNSAVTATMGGLIKLTLASGEFMLAGITAGHVLEELFNHDADDDSASAVSVSESACSGKTTNEENGAPHHTAFTLPRPLGNLLYPQYDGLRMTDGCCWDDIAGIVPKYDWALFDLDNNAKLKPNLLRRMGPGHDQVEHHRHHHHDANGGGMKVAPPESFPVVEPIGVVVVSGGSPFSQGAKTGELSHLPSGILLDPARGFVDTYLLTLHEGQVNDGDSGSWVINPVSMEVYGYVVASDCLGDAYVIPLHLAFGEMEELLGNFGVESVSLPTTADLLHLALLSGGLASSQQQQLRNSDDDRKVLVTDFLPLKTAVDEQKTSEMLFVCEGTRTGVRGDRDNNSQTTLATLAVDRDYCDSGYGSVNTPSHGFPRGWKLLAAVENDSDENEQRGSSDM